MTFRNEVIAKRKIRLEEINRINWEESRLLKLEEQKVKVDTTSKHEELDQDFEFAHLHAYTQFSILQSTSKISDLLKQCIEFSHDAIAITDKSNLMGAFHFIKILKNYNDNLQDNIIW